MAAPDLHVAIDLGASSARLFAGCLNQDRLEVEEVARLRNGPVQLPDGLHWDLLRIYQGMLEAVGQLSRGTGEGRLWVGIDSWGVDYGLLDADGRLLGPPFHYRDDRTAGRLEELDRIVGLQRLYEATGIQDMALNTICQLLAERGSGAYSVAAHLLLVPDLLAYLLTGERRLERTNASTTQLVDARTGELVEWLFPLLGLRRELFAAPAQPGEHYGPVLPEVAASVGMAKPPVVVAVASHDTASAVLGVPAATESFAYVVSGTWSLVGLELDAPVISEASWRANFSNELGYGGTVRFLKNVMGHWMLQECERCWALEGRSVRLVDVLAAAAACPPFRSLVDTADPVFAVPGDMPRLVRAACERSGEPVPESDGELVRCLLDSMALAICWALEEAQRCTGRQTRALHVVGGGSANRLLLSVLAACSGLEVLAGPVEASAVGNLLVQLHAAGRVGGRAEMRELVARSFPVLRVLPGPALARAAAHARSRWPARTSPPLRPPSQPGSPRQPPARDPTISGTGQ
jgi:rhamnulokinase